MKFQKLNMETWERADIFRHFIDDLRCVMSMTADIDVTALVQTAHERSLRFYPTMMWVVSTAVNRRQELRMGFDRDGNPGIWDTVSPYYAHFYQQDERFVKLVAEYSPNFDEFYRNFLHGQEQLQSLRGFELTDLPPNLFDLSCLPWIHYRSFDLHVFDEGRYLAPVIMWGRYTKDSSGQITLPLSLNIHHAAADGFHLCRFFSDVQQIITTFPSQNFQEVRKP